MEQQKNNLEKLFLSNYTCCCCWRKFIG